MLLMEQIVLDQSLQQLVPVHLADEGAGVVVVGDVGGILGQNIAHDLVDGVIALFLKGLIYLGEDGLDLQITLIGQLKSSSEIHFHNRHLLDWFQFTLKKRLCKEER